MKENNIDFEISCAKRTSVKGVFSWTNLPPENMISRTQTTINKKIKDKKHISFLTLIEVGSELPSESKY